jgi:hypothetical protein
MAESTTIWASLGDALDVVLVSREAEPRGPEEEIVCALLMAVREALAEMPQQGADFTVEVT